MIVFFFFLLFGKTDRIISTLNIIHQTFSFFNTMHLVDALLKPDAIVDVLFQV